MTLPTHEKLAEPVPNPAYDQWYEQDQAIISAIMSSLSPEVLSQCLFQEVWNNLDGLYGAQSQASAMQIRMQLATLKKQDLSATYYYNRVKHLVDTLAAAGEIVAYLLTGLLEESDSLGES
jgi:hypothetical protein